MYLYTVSVYQFLQYFSLEAILIVVEIQHYSSLKWTNNINDGVEISYIFNNFKIYYITLTMGRGTQGVASLPLPELVFPPHF